MILGLRTALYSVPDLAKARDWYAKAFGVQPYFDEPFYVGFSIGGYELGLDPDELGSPWGAAFGSFVAFAAGAAVPVLAYFVTSGPGAFAASLVLSLVALFAVGAAVSLLTGRGTVFSGLRQVGIGAVAAAVTYAVGTVVGVGIGVG